MIKNIIFFEKKRTKFVQLFFFQNHPFEQVDILLTPYTLIVQLVQL